MTKFIWPIVLGAGTTAGGGVAFMLPESLWSDAHTITIYKKGNEEGDNSYLRVGGEQENRYEIGTQNTESLLRVGADGLENMSANYEKTQNNSFWMVGGKYRKDSNSWQKKEMNKKNENNSKGDLSIFLTNIECEDLKMNSISTEGQVKFSCKSKNKL